MRFKEALLHLLKTIKLNLGLALVTGPSGYLERCHDFFRVSGGGADLDPELLPQDVHRFRNA